VSFANPWLLLGAAAALIPLLVHLFDRRRPRPHAFSAIAFVLRSQRRTASRLKLKRLLLYALRTLILLALPVALARPAWRQQTTRGASQRGPAATAIILDASLSMRYSDGTSLFERARELARDTLKDLLPEEPATVVLCATGLPPPAPAGFDRGHLRSAIDEAQATYARADLNRCMELGAQALTDSPLPAKRLVVISNFVTPSLRLDLPPPTVAGANGEAVRPEVVLRDAASGQSVLPNHALLDLKVEPALQVGPRAYQFTFTVKNFSPTPVKDLVAVLKVKGRVVAKGFVDVPAQGATQKSLTHSFDSGGTFEGEVALDPDALAEDDRRAFAVTVPKELQALVVNGQPNSVRYRDEAFFVDAALSANGSSVHETSRDTEAAFRESFDGYDLIFLLNVRAPDAPTAAKLVEFVKRGGGLFISMGDEVDPDAYNQRLGELLPRTLRLVKTSALPSDPDAESKASRFGQVSFDHPLFALFTGRAREGLMSARFYRYMLLESDERGGKDSSQVLATYEDGAPAFAYARRDKGRVLLYTSTVDRDWGDLAIRTAFLPLLQRASALLTGSLDEREEVRGTVGETLTLKPDGLHTFSSLQMPSGKTLSARPQADGSVLLGPLEEPGVHHVLDSKGAAVPGLEFAVHLDPAQSDLTRLKADELSATFGEDAVKKEAGSGPDRQTPLWTWLIIAAAAAFFFEGLLLRKV
jgi:hypothetical protein